MQGNEVACSLRESLIVINYVNNKRNSQFAIPASRRCQTTLFNSRRLVVSRPSSFLLENFILKVFQIFVINDLIDGNSQLYSAVILISYVVNRVDRGMLKKPPGHFIVHSIRVGQGKRFFTHELLRYLLNFRHEKVLVSSIGTRHHYHWIMRGSGSKIYF